MLLGRVACLSSNAKTHFHKAHALEIPLITRRNISKGYLSQTSVVLLASIRHWHKTMMRAKRCTPPSVPIYPKNKVSDTRPSTSVTPLDQSRTIISTRYRSFRWLYAIERVMLHSIRLRTSTFAAALLRIIQTMMVSSVSVRSGSDKVWVPLASSSFNDPIKILLP